MKAHKPLDWERFESDGGTVYAASDYFVHQYRIGGRTTWRLEGHGLDVIDADVDGLKRRAQDHDNRRRQLVAWEEYMLAHDPPTDARLVCGPVPVEGRVWLYRSDADGAEVLVRFAGGVWQTADPGLPDRWYAESGVLEWPGVFAELEEGLPR